MATDEQDILLRGEKRTNENGSVTVTFTIFANAVEAFERELSENTHLKG